MTNLWEALKLTNKPTPPVKYEYRVYYDELGDIKYYSTEKHKSKYSYIVIDQKAYRAGNYSLVVRNGKLVKLGETNRTQKLIPQEIGIMCYIDDVSIIVKKNGQPWGIKRYE
jgi:hypothetical protein